MSALLLIFRLRQRSLVRGILLSLGSFIGSLRLAGFPDISQLHGSYWQLMVLAFALWGLAETARCLQKQWNFYYVGVLLLLYTNVLILAMIVFLVFYP